MRKLTLFITLICSSTFLSYSQTPSTLDSLDQFILEQAERFQIPGIAVGVVKGDQLVFAKGYGWGNIEQQKKMTPQSIINIGSISKTITATAVMQLWERGKIDLDADVNNYLSIKVRNPNFPKTPITVRQLLTHSSSINDGKSFKEGYECGDPSVSLKDWIENYFSEGGKYYDAEDNFHSESPDSMYQYSNLGFGLLGYLVEQVSGELFYKYVQKNIFDPLEMKNTGYFLKDIDTSKMVIPYLYLGPLQKNLTSNENLPLKYFNPYCKYSFWNYPDGLVRTNIEDLSKFATAYMHGGVYKGKRILKKETIEMMHAPQLDKKINEDQDQGLSWFSSTGLAPSWYHGGSDPGISSRMYVDKENKLTVIVFQNANKDNTFYIVRKLYHTFLEKKK